MENNSKEERIERLAKMIVERFGMGTPALFLLEMYKPAAFVGGELGKVLLYPWLPLFGTSSEQIAREYIDLLEDRENLEKLLDKIEEFMGKKKRKEKGV